VNDFVQLLFAHMSQAIVTEKLLPAQLTITEQLVPAQPTVTEQLLLEYDAVAANEWEDIEMGERERERERESVCVCVCEIQYFDIVEHLTHRFNTSNIDLKLFHYLTIDRISIDKHRYTT
jgi:hypothetical protein